MKICMIKSGIVKNKQEIFESYNHIDERNEQHDQYHEAKFQLEINKLYAVTFQQEAQIKSLTNDTDKLSNHIRHLQGENNELKNQISQKEDETHKEMIKKTN